jgi:pyruvate/2-oxoglutarate dehydrogenase complex dihydrolipoamide acyltransferase (E2) component
VKALEAAARCALPLSVTFDRQMITGGAAARFLMALEADLEWTG